MEQPTHKATYIPQGTYSEGTYTWKGHTHGNIYKEELYIWRGHIDGRDSHMKDIYGRACARKGNIHTEGHTHGETYIWSGHTHGKDNTRRKTYMRGHKYGRKGIHMKDTYGSNIHTDETYTQKRHTQKGTHLRTHKSMEERYTRKNHTHKATQTRKGIRAEGHTHEREIRTP